METNPMANNLYSNMGSGMLGLEMSLHHQLPPQNHHQSHRMQQQQHPPPRPQSMVGFSLHDGGADQVHHPQPLNMCRKPGYPLNNKPKNQPLTLSDDDEHGGGTEYSGDGDGKRKMASPSSSPWQRMKWTDNMVRLLIMVVYYVGDDGAGGGSEGPDPIGKKKAPGILQKKGKWKSVSKAMMERGFFVSPQQCEDKFNDLNKRYKRVNDILGKGTSCKVVENQSLLDSMDHLSVKAKEEVKKLLNSKHLFFREMCAYHNSCSHGGGAAPEHGHQRQICLHSPANASSNLASGKRGNSYDGDEEEDDDEDDDEEEEDDTAIDESTRCSGKRIRGSSGGGEVIQRLGEELAEVMEDERRSAVEKRRWIKMRQMQVEEEQVGFRRQAFELEKQRLKWVKYSSNKERELEMDKLNNERMILENQKMSLLIRHKELELLQNMQQK